MTTLKPVSECQSLEELDTPVRIREFIHRFGAERFCALPLTLWTEEDDEKE